MPGAEEEADLRLAEVVDALHRVADEEECVAVAVGPSGGEQVEQCILAEGGILKLVDEGCTKFHSSVRELFQQRSSLARKQSQIYKQGGMLRILVLGVGLVGSAIALDLESDTNFQVSVANVNEEVVVKARMYGARCIDANLASPDTVRILAGEADLVISVLTGFMGFATLRAVIEAGRNIVDFTEVGILEAFNTDGFHRFTLTMPVPNMKEMTRSHNGHAELMRMLRDTGYFSKEEIDVRGTRIRPVDVTAQLLFPAWKLPEGEADVSIMRVVIEGERAGVRERRVYTLVDHYDPATCTTAMARTTGYTCAVAARLVADGTFTRKGVSPPEDIGLDATADAALMAGLHQRGVSLEQV